ncbi:hypothetical protein Vretimale_11576 [Volvox reticuliferus]|uniref:Uncharacterized protein n=1 Tax=Volvox reticuliferus TaxID=1737510 RepID=A0A8J4LS59_9CHLO|nr:hypothetical protein Vretifemale_14847 [Volvox reticuliferus]GIM07455.1 hypothetical protein Vretimale_11576 [Volvox reticuliferus]
MEDTCPNESPDNLVVKLASKTHCSFHIQLSRYPGQSAWHRSRTTSSLQDASSAVTSCTLPSACASGVLSYSSQPDLQSARDTATVAAASTNGLLQATALGTSCTCRSPSRLTTRHRAAPSKLHLQRYAEHGTNWPAVSQPITASCRQPYIAQWSQTRCDTAADAEATCCLLANAQATRTDLVAGPHRHIPKLPCCPPEVGSAAGLGRPPGNPASDVIGSAAPEMLWWPPDCAGGGGRDDSGYRAFSVSDSLLQLHADGSVGPLITAPPSPTSQWMLHHSWSQPPNTSGDTACIAPSDLPAGPWLSISARAAAHKLSPENLTAVAGVAAAPWPGALHGRSSPAGVAIPADPDPGLNKSYIQFAAAQSTPIWAAPAPTCSSLGDSCASPAQSSPSTPRSSSGNARQQAQVALRHVEFYRKHCGADDGDAVTVALETGGPMLAPKGSSEAGGLGAGTQMLHPGTPASGRNRGSGRHVIARTVPQLVDISVPARVKGAGGESGGNSRLRRAATGAPRLGCSPTQQQLLQGLYGNGSHSGGDGGCRITAAVMRSSSSPLSTLASSAGGARLSHNHSINMRHLAAKAASKAAAVATAAATATAGIHPQAVIADGTGSWRAEAVASPPRSLSAQEAPNGQATAVARQSLAPPPAMISLPVPVMGRSSLGSGCSSSRAVGSACSPASSSSPISSSPLAQVAPQLVPEHHALRLISCTLRASEVKRAPGARAGRVLTPEELSRRMLAETGGGGATKLLLTLAAGGTAELPPPASRSPRGTFPPIAEDEAGPQEGGTAAKTGGEYTRNDSECRLRPGCGCIVM